ncbi:MAG: nucleotidyltransferase family protein [Spirochaetes bacterium]|nr:nucleotidyltransferase family protein [Spirochaetota bacterium]
MKCVLLVAGFATRLYPLTLHTPKPLLEVGGKTILDRLIEKLEEIPSLDEVILVSNGKFFSTFIQWASKCTFSKKLTVLNDGALDNEHRLGAVADLEFAVRKKNMIEDTLVLAGDNLFDFSLKAFVDFFYTKGADCITAHRVEDPEQLRRTGVIIVNSESRVLEFEEKPKHPKSNLAVPPIYLYRSDTLPLLKIYLEEGNNPDAPGNFIPWLLRRKEVYAYLFPGKRYDIGTPESLKEVRRVYEPHT